MLQAYLDASGKDSGEPVEVVAGFVASFDCWEEFDFLWWAFLERHGLKRFHATEYWARKKPPYRDWNDAQHAKVGVEIGDILKMIKPFGVGCAVNTEAFAQWRIKQSGYIHSDPYYFCLDRCAYTLIRRLGEYPRDEGIEIYMDREGDRQRTGLDIAKSHEEKLRNSSTHVSNLFGRDRPVKVKFASSLDKRGLQLADILANGVFQELRGFLRAGILPPSPIFQRVRRDVAISVVILQDESMIDIDTRARP